MSADSVLAALLSDVVLRPARTLNDLYFIALDVYNYYGTKNHTASNIDAVQLSKLGVR